MKAKLKFSVHLHMGNMVHHTINIGESREVKIKINFALITFVYAGNMLFCVTNIFTSR